jgi:hypothetical protein
MSLNDDFNYQTSGFGVQAVFTISSGPTVTVSPWGIFTDASEAVNLLTGEIEANDASFSCNTSEVGTVKNGMSVVIDGTTYTVKRKQKLGTGDTLFYLKT